MARFGETLFRFAGALALAGAATLIDQPDIAKKGKRKPKPAMTATVIAQQVGISSGKRVFAIRIAFDANPVFALKPNDRVDVVAVVRTASGDSVAKLYMTDMRLLSIGIRGEQDQFPIASLEVTPEEAEALALAASQASLRVVLHDSWAPTRSKRDSAFGTARSCANTGPAVHLVMRDCPPRNPPPEFVAPRR
jgi:Flp pilus assembly protein CpaB